MGQPAPLASEPHKQEPPLDLVHLSRQTLGDGRLEREVLSLFASQARLYIDRIQNATSADERNMAAHTILGSARGVGAWRVAAAAETCRDTGHCPKAISELVESIAVTRTFIGELLLEEVAPLSQVG